MGEREAWRPFLERWSKEWIAGHDGKADAALDVVEDFLGRVRERALSDEVMRSLTPAQQVIKVVRDELTVTLGKEHTPFKLPGVNPVVIPNGIPESALAPVDDGAVRAIRDPRAPALAAICAVTVVAITLAFRGLR